MSQASKKIPLSDLKKSEQIVVRSGKNNFIDKLIFPNPVTIGLDGELRSLLTTEGGIKINAAIPTDTSNALYNSNGELYFSGEKILRGGSNSNFSFDGNKNLLKVTGSIAVSPDGSIISKNIVGSITQLVDGTQYIRSGDGISVTTGSTGQITVTALPRDTGIRSSAVGTVVSSDANIFHEKTLTLIDAHGKSITFTFDKAVNIDSPTRVSANNYKIGCKNITTRAQSAQCIEAAIQLAIDNEDISMYVSRTEYTLTLTQARPGVEGNTIIEGTSIDADLITFLNDCSFTGGSANNPAINANYLTINASGDLPNERSIAAGLGIVGSDLGPGSSYTLSIDTSKVPRLDVGNTFLGNQVFTGEIRGKHQRLASGADAFIAGKNISITNRVDGAVVISSTDNDTKYSAGNGLRLVGNQFSVKAGAGLTVTSAGISISSSALAGAFLSQDPLGKLQVNIQPNRGIVGSDNALAINTDDIVSTGLLSDGERLSVDPAQIAFLGGATFTGPVTFEAGLSGSLTRLENGKSFIAAGDNVSVVTGTDGQITISSSYVDTTYLPGPGLELTETTFGVALKDHGGLTFDDTEVILDTQTVIGEGLCEGVDGLIAVDATKIAFLTGTSFEGNVDFVGGLRGSLTQLPDGTSYLIAGDNINIVTQSNGSVEISSTASGSAIVAGATGDIQINISGSLASATGFYYDDAENALFVPRAVVANLTGSLTRLLDGSPFITSGPNITVTTGSNGQILISAAPATFVAARRRTVLVVSASHPAHEPLTLPGVDFSLANFESNLIDITCNGSLLYSGTSEELISSDVDYNIVGTSSISFAFDLVPNDVIQTAMLTSGSDTVTISPGGLGGANKSVQYNDSGIFSGNDEFTYDAFSGALSVKALSGSLTRLSDGQPYMTTTGSILSIVTGSNGSITISDSYASIPAVVYDATFATGAAKYIQATGPVTLLSSSNRLDIGLKREKFTHEVDSFHPANTELLIPDAQFSSAQFDEKRIDLYVNGQLLSSGTERDYELCGNDSGIKLSFDLFEKDIIIAVIQ